MPTIFLSYRRGDSQDATGRIYDSLVRHFPKDKVFKDVDSIPLGTDFRRVLEDAIRRADVVLAVIGPTWLTVKDEEGWRRLDLPDDFVRVELETALRLGKRVIPVPVSGAAMVTPDQLPESLKQLAFQNGMPVRPDPDFHNDMARLLAALGGSPRPEHAPPAPRRSGAGCAVVVAVLLVALLSLPLLAGLAFVLLRGFPPAALGPDTREVEDEPLSARLERARAEVAEVAKEMGRMREDLVRAEVEAKSLESDVATATARQEERKQRLLGLRERLETMGTKEDRALAERALGEYRQAEEALRQKADLLRERRKILEALREQYQELAEAKQQLSASIEEMEVAALTSGQLPRSGVGIDSDRLTRIKDDVRKFQTTIELQSGSKVSPPTTPESKPSPDLPDLLRRLDETLKDDPGKSVK